MPDYQTHDPRGWCGDPSRGAALGRPTHTPDDAPTTTVRVYVRRVRLNQGGYDRNGTYFGTGAPLYWYADDSGDIDGVLRASCRESAVAEVRMLYPFAKIKR